MADKVDNEVAFILHTRPWRESSLIVEAFTRHRGRISLVARGARRPMSSLKSRLLAFQPLLLSWFGKGAVRTLHDSEWQGGRLWLKGEALMCGFYLNELLLKLLPAEDPHEVLFDHYAGALETLGAGSEPEPVLRRFELALLSELGYAHTLDRTEQGQPVDPGERYGFVPDRGVVSPGHGSTVLGKTLLDMMAGDFDDPCTLVECKQLMRGLINHYLQDRPLLTRQLLIELQGIEPMNL